MTETTQRAANDISCREATALISRALEHVLSTDEEILLQRHLVDCGMCRRYKSQLTTLRTLMQELKK